MGLRNAPNVQWKKWNEEGEAVLTKKGSLSRILESPSRVVVGSIWKQQVEWTAERTLDGRGVWKWISSSLLVRPTFFEEMVFAPFCPCHSTHFAIAFQKRYWLPILLQPLFYSRPPFQFSFGTYIGECSCPFFHLYKSPYTPRLHTFSIDWEME